MSVQGPHPQALAELSALTELVAWIDHHTAGVTLPADERSLLAVGCFDVAIEHQAAIAVLGNSGLYGSAFALLRVLTESLVRGMWLHFCATERELRKFKKGRIEKEFAELVAEVEAHVGTPGGVLTAFKASAWKPMNGFTHTGFHQVSRRHSPGRVEGTYPDHEVAKAYGVAGALGLIAAGQIIGMSDRADRLPDFQARMAEYAQTAPKYV
jgi:hypothetical protein